MTITLFDADEDYKKRKSEVEKILRINTNKKVNTRNSDLDIFLFPDNQGSGKLENLLEKIIRRENKDIFHCFDAYKKCLKEKNTSYKLPGKKAKIYSYKQALGVIEKGKEHHFKPEYWNFQSSFLKPLKTFLSKNFS